MDHNFGKDLFIPLTGKFYDLFDAGLKRSELRLYGNRWNEKNCQVGRRVCLSRGYGKKDRMYGYISAFYRQRSDTFGSTYKAQIAEVYGEGVHWIARIDIVLDKFMKVGHGKENKVQVQAGAR